MADGKRKLVIEILSDAKGVNQGFDETEGRLGGLGKKLETFAKHAAIVVGVATVAFAKVAVDAASNFEESLAKSRVVFGDSSAEVEAWGKTSAKAFGLSNQEALEAAGTYGNLFQAFGLGRGEATKMSKSLVETAADLASFNNTSVDDALVALRSGLSGETEPLKRFGVAINDARLKEEALKLGLIKTTKEALTPAAKAQASYALIMHDTALAQGDFARTSGGLANQQRILEAQTNDLKVAIGEKLLPAKLAVVKFLNEKGIPAFQAFGEKLTDVYLAVSTLAKSTIGEWVGNIKEGFGQAREAFEQYGKAGDWEAHGTFEVLGVAAATAVETIKTKFAEAKQGFEQFQNDDWEAHGTFEKLGVVVARVVDGITGAFSHITQGVHAMGVAFIDGADDITSSGLEGKLEGVGVKARNFYDWMIKNKDTLIPIVGGLTAFAAALITVQKASAAISVITTSFQVLGPAVGAGLAPLLANPVGLIIAGVVALGVAAYLLYTKFKPFHDLMDKLGRSLRDFAEQNKVLAGVLLVLVAPMAAVAVGAVLIVRNWDKVMAVFRTVSEFITEKVIPTFSSIYDTIVEALTPLAHWIDENVISTFVAFGEAVGAAIESIIAAWKVFWTFIEPGLKLLVTLVESTFTYIAGIFKAFVDVALPVLAAAWDIIKAPVKIAFDAVKGIIETVLGAIRGVFEIFTGILHGDFGKIWEGFKDIVVKPFTEIKEFIGDTFNTIWDLIKGFPSRIAGIVVGMWDGFKEAFRSMINFIIRGWNSLDFTIGGFELPFPPHTKFPSVTIGLPNIPQLAAGGIVNRPTLALIGERGPEAVIPLGRGGGAGVTNYITINATDPDSVIAAIQRWTRQNGPIPVG